MSLLHEKMIILFSSFAGGLLLLAVCCGGKCLIPCSRRINKSTECDIVTELTDVIILE
jgi:hypothetical protein